MMHTLLARLFLCEKGVHNIELKTDFCLIFLPGEALAVILEKDFVVETYAHFCLFNGIFKPNLIFVQSLY